MQNFGRVHRIFGGDGVVADVPKRDRGKDQKKGCHLLTGKLAAGGPALLFLLIHNREALSLHIGDPFPLTHGEEENKKTEEHDAHDRDDVERKIGLSRLGGVEGIG